MAVMTYVTAASVYSPITAATPAKNSASRAVTIIILRWVLGRRRYDVFDTELLPLILIFDGFDEFSNRFD